MLQKLTYPHCSLLHITFDNLNSVPCLEHFLLDPNNRLAPYHILSYGELNVVAPISLLAMHKIFFSFSWRTILLIIILKSTLSQDFQHKIGHQWIFVKLSKKPPYFCSLEVFFK